mgnify:CR=1 FL=1
MDLFFLLLKGVIIGILIAAPVGPVGVLCIRRTINDGWPAGLIAGSGAALADALYGAVAAFGIVYVSDFILDNQVLLKLIGGGLLIIIGAKMIYDRSPVVTHPDIDTESDDQQLQQNPFSEFVTTFFITLTNPGTIIAFIAIFAGLGIANYSDKPISASILVAGVFIGALAWWTSLNLFVGRFDHKIGINIQRRINLISGAVILAFAGVVFLSLML